MRDAVATVLGLLLPRERTIYWMLVVGRALTGLLDVVGILLIGIVSAIAAASVSGGPAPVVLGMQIPALDSSGLLWLVVGVLAAFLLKALLAVTLMRAQSRFVARVETRNAAALAASLLAGSPATMRRHSRADIQFAITDSTVYAFTGLLNNVATLVAESFLVLVIVATLTVVDPVVAAFTLLYFAIVVVVIQGLIGRALKRAGREAVDGTLTTIGAIGDTLAAHRELTVLQKREVFVARIDAARARIANSGATLTFLGGMPRYVIETALMLGVVLLVASLLAVSGPESALVIVGVFLTGGVRMMASLVPLQNAVANIRQNAEKAKPALELLSTLAPPTSVVGGSVPDALGATALGTTALGTTALPVRLTEVSYRYPGADRDAVVAVNLVIEPGAFVALIGPSGAGKTTIADLVLGVLEPDHGTVEIGSARPDAVRAASPGVIAYVPQKPGLVAGTISENIALGVAPAELDHERIAAVVGHAHLGALIESLPDGLDSSVGAHADAVSGGQAQRIGIARALYPAPRLLVLDEATSALDAGSEAVVAERLHELKGEVTVIVVAHRLSTVQRADVVHVVEDGRITASGTFAEVRAAAPMVEEYVRLMSFDEQATDVLSSDEQASDEQASAQPEAAE